MAPHFAAVLGALTLVLSLAASHVNASCARGLGWATNNQYGSNMGHTSEISWYHHWQDGPVPEIGVEFVPMFWGPSKQSLWNSRVAEMKKKTPKHLMGFNEPDVTGQANMNADYAAQLFMQEIYPWSKEGVQLGSPAVVWDLNWLNTFLNALKQKGGQVDFICLHWYGPWNDLAGFQKYVQTAHSRFGKNIWITELGITSASNPSQSEVKSFMVSAFNWMDTQSYVVRGAWFGSWESNHPPDSYSTHFNALLQPGGALNDMGNWYCYAGHAAKRSLPSRHHMLARNTTDVGNGPTECDDICVLRKTQLDSYYASLPASS